MVGQAQVRDLAMTWSSSTWQDWGQDQDRAWSSSSWQEHGQDQAKARPNKHRGPREDDDCKIFLGNVWPNTTLQMVRGWAEEAFGPVKLIQPFKPGKSGQLSFMIMFETAALALQAINGQEQLPRPWSTRTTSVLLLLIVSLDVLLAVSSSFVSF